MLKKVMTDIRTLFNVQEPEDLLGLQSCDLVVRTVFHYYRNGGHFHKKGPSVSMRKAMFTPESFVSAHTSKYRTFRGVPCERRGGIIEEMETKSRLSLKVFHLHYVMDKEKEAFSKVIESARPSDLM